MSGPPFQSHGACGRSGLEEAVVAMFLFLF